MRLRSIAALFAAVLVLASCATTRGGSYASGSSRESAAAAASARAKQAEEIQRKPPPQAPAPAPSTSTGPFFALAQSDLPLAMEPRRGHLRLEGLPADSLVTVDGLTLPGPSLSMGVELEMGSHSVEVRTFGYKDWRESIDIGEGDFVELRPLLEKAAFGLRDFGFWPRRFNPEDPGFYGEARLSLEAFSPGTLTIEVLSPSGRVLRELRDLPIERASWSWMWDGRDEAGRALGDGRYSVLALDGSGAELGKAEVSLDRSLMARSAILASGSGGPLFVPAARPMAAGGLELSSFAMAHVASANGIPTGRIVSGLGSRIGLPPPISVSGNGLEEPMELDLSFAGYFHPGEVAAPSSDAFEMSAALLIPLASSPILSSLLAKFSYGSFFDAGDWPSPYDGLARFPGLSLALPLEYDQAETRIFLAPELCAGLFYPNYDPARVPGFYSWAYLRGGIESTMGPLSFALSGALRSAPFDGGFRLALPLPAGFEIRWHSKKLPLVLSFLLTGEFDTLLSWYLNSGLSLAYRL